MAEIVETKDVLDGKPRIDGTRIAVEHIIEDIRAGRNFLSLITAYDSLYMEDVEAAVLYYIRNIDEFREGSEGVIPNEAN